MNDLLQRLRACKVHLLLIDHLRKQLSTPMLVGLGPKKGMKKLLDDLHMQFIQVWAAGRQGWRDAGERKTVGEGYAPRCGLRDLPKGLGVQSSLS